MNPNYLTKEELLYELGVRGISCTEDIDSLRRTFRAVYLRDVPIDLQSFDSACVEEWIALLSSRIYELQGFVEKLESQPVLSVSRIQTQVLHIGGRVKHLESSSLRVGQHDRGRLRKLHQTVDVIEQTVKMATQAEQTTSDRSRTPGNEVERSNHQTDIRSPTNVSSLLFSSDIYQKIENPLNYLLKQVPMVDGNDIDCLCVFLLKALNIIKIAQILPPKIYEMLMPRCKGELLECLHQALLTGEAFDSFHARVIQRFIRQRIFLRLRLEVYDRAQRKEETLASYIQSIKDAASYLRIQDEENQIVARVVAGLHPTQRVRFCFQPLPTTFAHWDQLVTLDRVEKYEDRTRDGETSSGVSSGQSRESSISERTPLTTSRQYQKQNKPKICFRCGKSVHIQRYCFVKSSLDGLWTGSVLHVSKIICG
jgi:hypothetical protein